MDRLLFRDQASFCALINHEGQVVDHLRLVHIVKNGNSMKPGEANLKVSSSFIMANLLLLIFLSVMFLCFWWYNFILEWKFKTMA